MQINSTGENDRVYQSSLVLPSDGTVVGASTQLQRLEPIQANIRHERSTQVSVPPRRLPAEISDTVAMQGWQRAEQAGATQLCPEDIVANGSTKIFSIAPSPAMLPIYGVDTIDFSEFSLQNAERLLSVDGSNVRDHRLRNSQVRGYGYTPAENPAMRQKRTENTQNYATSLHQMNKVDDLDVKDLLYENEAVLCQLPVVGYENFPLYPQAQAPLVGGHGTLTLTNERIIMTFNQDSTKGTVHERRTDNVSGYDRKWRWCPPEWCCCDAESCHKHCECCECCISSNPIQTVGGNYTHRSDKLFISRVATVDIASSLLDTFSEHADSLKLVRDVNFFNPNPENSRILRGIDISQINQEIHDKRSKTPILPGTTLFDISTGMNPFGLPEEQSSMVSEYELRASAPVIQDFSWSEYCRRGRYRAVHIKHLLVCNPLMFSETVVVIDPEVTSLRQLHTFSNEAKRVLKENSTSARRTTGQQPLQKTAEAAVGALRFQVLHDENTMSVGIGSQVLSRPAQEHAKHACLPACVISLLGIAVCVGIVFAVKAVLSENDESF